MVKVFCTDCKWYREESNSYNRIISIICNHPLNKIYKDAYKAPNIFKGHGSHPEKLNKNNNCEWFEECKPFSALLGIISFCSVISILVYLCTCFLGVLK